MDKALNFIPIPKHNELNSCAIASSNTILSNLSIARKNESKTQAIAKSEYIPSLALEASFPLTTTCKVVSAGDQLYDGCPFNQQRRRKRAGLLTVASVKTASRIDLDVEPSAALDHLAAADPLCPKRINDPSLTTSKSQLSGMWRDVQGQNNWEGLLDPISPALRDELIRYGELAQVCYDAFDFEKYSKYCGSCKYNRLKLLKTVGWRYAADYEVTKYLYATSHLDLPHFFHRSHDTEETWSRDSNWMGFVAVSTSASEIQRLGRRDIVVAWRGTVTAPEWINNLQEWLAPCALVPSEAAQELGVKVERGFGCIYTSKNQKSRYNKESAQEQLLSEIRRLVKKYQGEELSITITGHSLGGAMALLSAYDIAESGINCIPAALQRKECSQQHHSLTEASERIPITVFTFAGPRVGNDPFRERCQKLGIKTLRVVNQKDVVPKVPGIVLNEHMHILRNWMDMLPWTYSHIGPEIALNTEDSPYLQSRRFLDVAGHHNLEAHLHLLDAYRSSKHHFSSSGPERDVALINKFSDLLNPECCIPPYWWQEQNEGLVGSKLDGRWVQRDRQVEDIPILYRDL